MCTEVEENGIVMPEGSWGAEGTSGQESWKESFRDMRQKRKLYGED